MNYKFKTTVFITIALSFCLTQAAQSLTITDPEIIWQAEDTGFDGSFLGAEIVMSYIADTDIMTIILKNTTDVAGGDASDGILDNYDMPSTIALTGLGFNFGDYDIFDGEVLSENPDVGVDLSAFWGYDNGPLEAGPFQNSDITSGIVDTTIATLQAAAMDDAFATGGRINGPPDGILPDGIYHDLYVNDFVTITLSIGQDLGGDEWDRLFDIIEAGSVVASFGSPQAAPVPEPATMLLFGTGLVGLAGTRYRNRKKK